MQHPVEQLGQLERYVINLSKMVLHPMTIPLICGPANAMNVFFTQFVQKKYGSSDFSYDELEENTKAVLLGGTIVGIVASPAIHSIFQRFDNADIPLKIKLIFLELIIALSITNLSPWIGKIILNSNANLRDIRDSNILSSYVGLIATLLIVTATITLVGSNQVQTYFGRFFPPNARLGNNPENMQILPRAVPVMLPSQPAFVEQESVMVLPEGTYRTLVSVEHMPMAEIVEDDEPDTTATYLRNGV